MASSQLIRLGKIKGKSGILVAMQHNKRTLQAETGASANIDATRTHLNYSLASIAETPETIVKRAKVLMVEAGIDVPRKNAVMAVELIFSLPNDRHNQDTRQFFTDCLNWTKQTFAGELLSFDVHLDEAAPHAHAVILPLVNGKMQGHDMVGNTGNLMRLINKFHAEIARHYGLSRSDKKRLTNSDKQSIEKQVLMRLKSDPVMKSCVWACVRDAIHSDPLSFAQSLGITSPAKRSYKNKSYVVIMTSKGKGSAINAI